MTHPDIDIVREAFAEAKIVPNEEPTGLPPCFFALNRLEAIVDAANWLMENRGQRGEEQAMHLLAQAMFPNRDDNPHPDA